MFACPTCRFEARSRSGLASHRRAKHPKAAVAVSVEQAVRVDLEKVAGAEGMRSSAIALARAIDETTSARDLASLTRELRATLDGLGVRPETEEQEADGVDELAARRDARRAAASTAPRPAEGQ